MTRPDLKVEIAFDSDPGDDAPVWTDVSDYVMAVKTKRGRQSELSRDEAGTASVTLKNLDRRFDPLYDGSPYYPNVIPMRRIRVRASLGDEATASSGLVLTGEYGSFAYTDDNITLGGPGDHDGIVDVRAKIQPDTWQPDSRYTIICANDPDDDDEDPQFALQLKPAGLLSVRFTGNGSVDIIEDSTAAVAFTDGQTRWVRVVLDVGYASGQYSIDFYTSTDGSSWSALGSQIIGDWPTPEDAFMPPWWNRVMIGSLSPVGNDSSGDNYIGRVMTLQVRDETDTEIADPDFENATEPPDGELTDSYGSVWYWDSPAHLNGHYYPIYSGFVLSWPQIWPTNRAMAVVTLECVDAFHILSMRKITQAWSSEGSGARIDSVLDDVGWPIDARRISDGDITLSASDVEECPAIEHIQHIIDSELGRFFIGADGDAVFRSRSDVVGHPTTTFGDDPDEPTEMPYLSIGQASYGESPLYNNIRVARVDGSYVTVSDADSVLKYMGRTLTLSNLLVSDDDAASAIASLLLNRYKDPKLRIEDMELSGECVEGDELWRKIFDHELGDYITIKRRPPGGGEAIEQTSAIEGVEHDITPKEWRVNWRLSPSTAIDVFILDSEANGILDTNTLL